MKKKVSCELCNLPAKTYCESDQASLCFHCDTKVHKANFLVTKHSRILLCHLCQNPTPWTASGPMLPPSLSLCVSCANSSLHAAQSHQTTNEIAPQQAHHHDTYDDDHDDDDNNDEEDSSSDIDEDEDEEEEEEDDDNQVVPLTMNSTSSSIETEDEDDGEDGKDDDGTMLSSLSPSSLKRKREIYLLS